ncbi:MAG: ATP-binding protein, partial [Deferribacterales bacterium]
MKKNNDFFVSQSRKDAYDLIDKYIKEKVYLLFFIGESGVGKSKFLKHLTEHIQSIDVVIMDQFYENPTIFFKALIENLNLNTESYSKQDMINMIAQYSVDKIAENKKLILIIDDISGISEEIIKDISKLYEFEYNNAKILNIILTGDNKNFQIIKEWQEKYFRFVSSSVVYLNPFNKTETITFLKNACEKYNIDISDFSKDNYTEVYLYTEGIPDRI